MLEYLLASPAMKDETFQQWHTTYPYPQNMARNVAKKGANTKYTFVTDVDIVPSEGSAKMLAQFLTLNTCAKCAYVVATYELEASVLRRS